VRILHVGCGGDQLPPWLEGDETRLDIDPVHRPHIVASMTDMGDIGQYDTIFCSHALEHLNPFNVEKALREFVRVLSSGGTAIIIVPDTEGVEPNDAVLFVSPSGPITGYDIINGHSSRAENPYMAHHSCFTAKTLRCAMERSGFARVATTRAESYNLIAAGLKA
jgi:ubiquinone/menaquinone biosynthesis C-methylase UbiE